MNSEIPALTPEQLASTKGSRFTTKDAKQRLGEDLAQAMEAASKASNEELRAAYEILMNVYESAGIKTFGDLVDRIVAQFDVTEMFDTHLLTKQMKPVFHSHVLDVLQEGGGPEKPFRRSPLDILAKWLYDADTDEPSVVALKAARKNRKPMSPVVTQPPGSGTSDGVRDRGEEAVQRKSLAKEEADAAKDKLPLAQAAKGESRPREGSPARNEPADQEDFESAINPAVGFNAEQMNAAIDLQAKRSSTRFTDGAHRPYSTEGDDRAMEATETPDRSSGAPEPSDRTQSAARPPKVYSPGTPYGDVRPTQNLLFDWRQAIWNEGLFPEDKMSGDKALNTAYSSMSGKFCDNNGSAVITAVHTSFVQTCIRYNLKVATALPYVSILYGGTAQADYMAYLRRAAENREEVSVNSVFCHMESLYNTRQSRTMAQESLSALRFGADVARTEAVATYEREFRRFQASAGPMSEESLLQNLQFALRDPSNDFSDSTSTRISSGEILSFSQSMASLRAAAATADARNPRTGGSSSSSVFANTAERTAEREKGRGGFDNRRLSRTFRRWSKDSATKGNPLDRRTGKPMVCRSPGCESTDHLQYSGRCPVQQRRMKNGNARAYMAAAIEEDIDSGIPVEDVLTEILFSQGGPGDEEESDTDPDDGVVNFASEYSRTYGNDHSRDGNDWSEEEGSDHQHSRSEEQNFRADPTKAGIFGGVNDWWRF